ncbi:hypothetical protein EV128_104333 [Rhizobium azibense]|nr:hypothetical protein EV128_104333 [Rhizobium azibense]
MAPVGCPAGPTSFCRYGVLSRLFRRLLLEELKIASEVGALFRRFAQLSKPANFKRMLAESRGVEWVVYSKPPFAGSQQLGAKAERPVDALWNPVGEIVKLFEPQECANYFAAAGYDPDSNGRALAAFPFRGGCRRRIGQRLLWKEDVDLGKKLQLVTRLTLSRNREEKGRSPVWKDELMKLRSKAAEEQLLIEKQLDGRLSSPGPICHAAYRFRRESACHRLKDAATLRGAAVCDSNRKLALSAFPI